MKKKLTIFMGTALALTMLHVSASWVTNDFRDSGFGTNTISVEFTPQSTYFVTSNGVIIYTSVVSANAINGIMEAQWLEAGTYTVNFGPRPDAATVNVPYDTNTYSLWQLITNATVFTSFLPCNSCGTNGGGSSTNALTNNQLGVTLGGNITASTATNLIGTGVQGNFFIANSNILNAAVAPISPILIQQAARGKTNLVNGLNYMGLSLVEGAFFAPGYNLGASNLIGLNGTMGYAYNCVQVPSGLYVTNGAIFFTNFPVQSGAFTLVFFGCAAPFNQIDSACLFSFAATNGFTSSGGYGFGHIATSSAHAGYSYNNASFSSLTDTGLGDSYVAVPDHFSRCIGIASDRTNLYMWLDGAANNSVYPGIYQTNIISGGNTVPCATICLGAQANMGSTNTTLTWTGTIQGFLLFTNVLTTAQIQNVKQLCQQTVLVSRRAVTEGDSIIGIYSAFIWTNSPFSGNFTFNQEAAPGSTLAQETAKIYPGITTNMPNGQDLIYPSVVLFAGGINSISGGNSAASLYPLISNEVYEVHGMGGLIWVATLTENVSSTPTPALEGQRVLLNQMILSNTAGADGIVDNDAMWLSLLHTNYYTNTIYFADGTHPTTSGDYIFATNWVGVMSNAVLTSYPIGASTWPTPSVLFALTASNLTGIGVPTNFFTVNSNLLNASVAPQVLTGNGSGLTNIQGSNIIGSLTNNVAFATNAQTAAFVTGVLTNKMYASNVVSSWATASLTPNLDIPQAVYTNAASSFVFGNPTYTANTLSSSVIYVTNSYSVPVVATCPAFWCGNTNLIWYVTNMASFTISVVPGKATNCEYLSWY